MHEPLARAMLQCAQHVLGPRASALCIDVPAISDIEQQALNVLQQLQLQGQRPRQRFLLLNDLYGATPYRVAQRVLIQLLKQGHEGFLISGVSLPMLLKVMTDPADADFAVFVDRIAQTAARTAVYE